MKKTLQRPFWRAAMALTALPLVAGCGTKSETSGPKEPATTPKKDTARNADVKDEGKDPKWGEGSQAKNKEPTRKASAAGQVTFKKIGGGMVHLAVKSPGSPAPSGTGKVRTVRVLRDEKSYKSFISGLPKKTITKGPGKPNPDPLLKSPNVDFTKDMVVLVEYDFMWSTPKVKKVHEKDGKLWIQAEFKMPEAIMQHAGGVGSYTAIVVPRSDLTPALETP